MGRESAASLAVLQLLAHVSYQQPTMGQGHGRVPEPSGPRRSPQDARAKQLINTLDPTGGFTEQQALELWRAYDTTGSGRLTRQEALKFFQAIVSRMKVLGQLPSGCDDLLYAERLLNAMDRDGDGMIAWTEWSQMTDEKWQALISRAREAVAMKPAQGSYPTLPAQGGYHGGHPKLGGQHSAAQAYGQVLHVAPRISGRGLRYPDASFVDVRTTAH